MAFFNFPYIALVSTLLITSINGACVSPSVRREWRSLSSSERVAWIDAIKCLSKLPHDPTVAPTVDPALSLIPPMAPTSSRFDDFVYTHMDLNVQIHGTGLFFPWHRKYLQAFEDDLRTKCSYAGVQPYWNWTQDAAQFYTATIFSDDPNEGLGGWGDPNNDFQISTGGFANMTVAYPVPHYIRRNYTILPFIGGGTDPFGILPVKPLLMINNTFTEENVNFTVSSFTGNYVNFQAYLENINGPHPGAHLILGGDMRGFCPFGLGPPDCYLGTKWSANDPMFFLHHAMIDKLWFQWQLRDSSNANAFAGGSVSAQVDPSQAATYPTGSAPFLDLYSAIPGDGLWTNVTIQDIMDTVGENLCYIYD